MIHFLRSEYGRKGDNIIETMTLGSYEDFNFDLYSVINTKVYSEILLNISESEDINIYEFINDINNLNELRRWYWEELNKESITSTDDIEKLIANKYIEIANKYDLYYVAD